jgi:hypothetical protein
MLLLFFDMAGSLARGERGEAKSTVDRRQTTGGGRYTGPERLESNLRTFGQMGNPRLYIAISNQGYEQIGCFRPFMDDILHAAPENRSLLASILKRL